MSPRVTRREALALGAATILAGCGGGREAAAGRGGGSSLQGAFADPRGEGVLRRGAGVPLLDRDELAPRSAPAAELATFAHLTDAHVLDAQSPARVTFLDRLGPPFTSTFRPQEALTAQVLAGAVRAINAFAPQAVIQGGDLIDNAQGNELGWALAVLRGERVRADSGPPGYQGVQQAANPDPFYYRPDVDAPRHPGLLRSAVRPFAPPRLGAPWYPVLGDHDVLVAGVLAPSPITQSIARRSRAVWELPTGLALHAGAGSSPDGLAQSAAIDRLLGVLRRAPGVTVAPDPRRRQLAASQVLAALRSAAGRAGGGAFLDYGFDVGRSLRVLVLDLVRRDGGSGGVVHPGQAAWLERELTRAGTRWVIAVSHQPLDSSAGGPGLLAVLDGFPRVVAALWGHTHRHRITPRPGPGGGYWLISTASLIDHPQQARAFRLLAGADGGVALQTWLLDHVSGPLGDISRQLAYLDAQGGRPQGFAGDRRDGNATLYKRARGH